MPSAKFDPNDAAAKYGDAFIAGADALADAAPGSGCPPPVDLADMLAKPPPRPPDLIENVAFKGSKIILAAPSKARKTFMQQHFALCVATGTPWFGRAVARGRVLYINMELRDYTFQARARHMLDTMAVQLERGWLEVWNLRGQNTDAARLEKAAAQRIAGPKDLIVFDPLYKLLGEWDENKSKDMALLYGCFERIAGQLEAAYMVATHFAKGSAAFKESIDRAAGSNVAGRDADAYFTMTPHEQEDCFAFEATVRDHAPVPPCVLRWTHPLFEVDPELDPADLKKPGKKAEKKERDGLDDAAFATQLSDNWRSREEVCRALMKEKKWSRDTARNAVSAVVSRNDLLTLAKDDGERNCKSFVAIHLGRLGLHFKLPAKKP